jgi:hypothetical protein
MLTAHGSHPSVCFQHGNHIVVFEHLHVGPKYHGIQSIQQQAIMCLAWPSGQPGAELTPVFEAWNLPFMHVYDQNQLNGYSNLTITIPL